MRHHVAGLLDAAQEAQRLKGLDHLLARREPVQAAIFRRRAVVHAGEIVEDVDHRQVVALADHEVVEVVGGRDLNRAGALFRVGVIVGDDRHRPIDDGQAHGAADHGFVALVGGMHGDGGVAQHGFGAGGGDHDLAGAVLQRIGEVPVVAVDLALLDLQVGDRRLEVRIPVHQPLVTVDELFLVKRHKDLANRRRQPLVEGEPLAAPVAARAQALQLVGDGPAGLGLPLPDLFDEGVAAQVAAALVAGLGELTLHHHLGGDPGVVGAGQPERGLAPHPLEADQHILQGVVERMPDMQRAGDIGRRDDDRERLGGRIVDRGKPPRRLPGGIEARLDGFRIEGLFKHLGILAGAGPIIGPLIPPEAGTQAFSVSAIWLVTACEREAQLAQKHLGPRFRGDERIF